MKIRHILPFVLCMGTLPLPFLNAAEKMPPIPSEFKRVEMAPKDALEKTYRFLKEAGTYYLATAEGDQPRVRPFGTVLIFKGKLYIQTGKHKFVSKQISANPKVELCAFKKGEWIRVSGTLVNDDSREVKQAMLDAYPSLKTMYAADDPNTQVLYLKDAQSVFYSFGKTAEAVRF